MTPITGIVDVVTALVPRALIAGLLVGIGHRTRGSQLRRNVWLLAVSTVVGISVAHRFWPLAHDDLFTVWAALAIALTGLVPTYTAALFLDRRAILVRDEHAWMIDDTPPATRVSRAMLVYVAAALPAALVLCYALRPLLVR